MKIGYARVSTRGQNLDRQIDALEAAGCDKIYQEKVSGANDTRPELQRLLETVREGDIIVVDELSRLSRGTADLFAKIEFLHEKNVVLESLTEKWLDTSNTPIGNLLLTIFAGLNEFERACTMERAEKGRIAARKRGVKFGRPNLN